MTSSLKAKYHILAILTVAVWGTTFISTKILINNGLSPQEIFLLRFIIAYIGIWFISPRKIFSDSIKDELTMFAAGLTGGTLYFLTENTSLKFTQTTNVAFIICATPLLTTGLSLLTDRNNKVSHNWLLGSIVALIGVAILIFNGSVILKLSPIGDFLTLAAALSWAFYSLIINKLSKKYRSIFITRKIFFYGTLGILPAFIIHPFSFPLEGFLRLLCCMEYGIDASRYDNVIKLFISQSIVYYLSSLCRIKRDVDYLCLHRCITGYAGSIFIYKEQIKEKLLQIFPTEICLSLNCGK